MKTRVVIAVADTDNGGKKSNIYWLAKVSRVNKNQFHCHYYGTQDNPPKQRFLPAWTTKRNTTILLKKLPDIAGSKPWTGIEDYNSIYAIGIKLTSEGYLDKNSSLMLNNLSAHMLI
jgi:hypothetical protein